VIAIITILAAFLFPVFAQAREKARQSVCLSNMRQVGVALYMYTQDFDEMLPLALQTEDVGRPDAPVDLIGALEPYTKDKHVFACPSTVNGSLSGFKGKDPTELRCTSYMGNSVVLGRPLAVIPNPAEIVYFQEDTYRWRISWLRPRAAEKPRTYTWWHWDQGSVPAGKETYSSLHSEGGNLVFADGHVKYKPYQKTRSSDFGLVPDDGHEANANKRYLAAF
jgi:prepilin-type processing-associated H-X9-DG protein